MSSASRPSMSPRGAAAVMSAFANGGLPMERGIRALVATQFTPERSLDRYGDRLQVYAFASSRLARGYLKPLNRHRAALHHQHWLVSQNVVSFFDDRMKRAVLFKLRHAMGQL